MDSNFSVQNKNFSGDGKEFKKVSRAVSAQSRKSLIMTILENLANHVKTHHEIIVREHAHRSETNGIAERAVRRVKEGTSAVLLQSGLDEIMVG